MTNTDGSAQACNEADSPRAVFVDIDGTLCDSRQRIPRSAIDALHEVRSNGHRLFACTGRSAPEVYPRFWTSVSKGSSAVPADTPLSGIRSWSMSACHATTSRP